MFPEVFRIKNNLSSPNEIIKLNSKNKIVGVEYVKLKFKENKIVMKNLSHI